MNLQEELERLAVSAPPITQVDDLIRLARRSKARRAVAVPLAVALVTLVAFLPNWSPGGSAPANPWETRSFLRLTGGGPIAGFDELSATLRRRAIAAGFQDPVVRRIDANTVELSVTGQHAEGLLREVARAQQLQARRVLDLTYEQGPSAPGILPGAGDAATSLAALRTKLGEAYQAAEALRSPRDVDPATEQKLAVFGQLTPAEVELLPAQIQFNVPAVSCAHLNARPSLGSFPLNEWITACNRSAKALLDVAKLTGEDVASTRAAGESSSNQMVVDVDFTPSGKDRLTELSREAFNNTGSPRCSEDAVGDRDRCRIGFLTGRKLHSLPEIQAVLRNSVELSDGFSRERAAAIAAVMFGNNAALTLTVVGYGVNNPTTAPPTTGQ